jgi:hypothetical protein
LADLNPKEFKLKNGRAVTLRLLKPVERGCISDMARSFVVKNPHMAKDINNSFSMEALYQAVIYATDDELLEDWTSEDIVRAGTIILEMNYASELEKKS